MIEQVKLFIQVHPVWTSLIFGFIILIIVGWDITHREDDDDDITRGTYGG